MLSVSVTVFFNAESSAAMVRQQRELSSLGGIGKELFEEAGCGVPFDVFGIL